MVDHVIFRSRQMIFLFTNPMIFLEIFFKTGQEKRDFLKKLFKKRLYKCPIDLS